MLIVGRELLVSGLRGFSESKGKSYGSMYLGKIKMVVQSTTAPWILLVVAHPNHSLLGSSTAMFIQIALIWLTVIVTTGSMLQYLIRSKDILSEAYRQ